MRKHLLQLGWQVYRDQGLWSLIHHAIGEIGYRRVLLLERSLAAPIPVVQSKASMTIEWLTDSDSTDYFAFRPKTDRELYADRLRQGHRCLLARVEGRLAGVMWVRSGSVWSYQSKYLHYERQFAPNEAYLYDAYTDPAFRGQAIAPALSSELLNRLRNEGCERAIRGTHPMNAAALRAHGKAGFRPFVAIHQVHFWRWHHVWQRAR
ncbi:N-acetyltransferase [Prosthecobacter sp.]|uniref:GNAT family N-acetyltransferase n=1 Tax=Prosthecobacter sp. TaxID=1965333 RepID=UPI002AB8E31A|nr:N-acetyltransferase [Prosthecobacter sp.]MDZ4405902.1 N-acetyltransferase [Prosthecobacter sp.]